MSSYNKRITYFGVIKSISSWSKVARELLSSLIELGIDINIYQKKGFLYDENFNLGALEKYISPEFSKDIIFTFEHPKNYIYLPDCALKIGFLVYEFTSLPDLWVENINKYLDMVIVPSLFSYNVFIDSGISKEKIRILRYGINPKYYFYRNNKNEALSFLTIASPQKREALDIALESFYKAYSDVADVKLTVKLSYNIKYSKPFEIRDFNGLISDYKQRLANRLEIIANPLSEQEMGELYRKSDLYFSLSKAESFGLCFLEAIACGKPVISLNYGGTKDFLTSHNAYFISHKISQTNGEEYEISKKRQFIAIPYMESAVRVLKEIYQGKNLKKPSLEKSLEYYYWENIAKDFIEIIKNYEKGL
jgi:glycosyltransferase involved in cell wall biosynthesis